MPLKDKDKRNEYSRKYNQERIKKDPEFKASALARTRKNDLKYKNLVQELIDNFRANGCILCEKEHCCLVAHHLDPNEKDFSIGNAKGRKIGTKRVTEELSKCVCLCENCHRKLHAGLIKI